MVPMLNYTLIHFLYFIESDCLPLTPVKISKIVNTNITSCKFLLNNIIIYNIGNSLFIK